MGVLLRTAIATTALTTALTTVLMTGGCAEETTAAEQRTGTRTESKVPTGAECAAGDLTAAVTESPAPNDRDKLFRLTFTAADGMTSCYLSGPPQAMVFRDAANAELPVDVVIDPGDKPRPILVDTDHQAETYVTTPLADANTAPARADFTMPTGGPTGTTFSLTWPSPIGREVTVTPVTAPVS